jgi:hypothetical protein
MEAKLIKTPEQLYKLEFYNDKNRLACATALLSKQNCDEIFGVVDVEKLAREWHKQQNFNSLSDNIISVGYLNMFKDGFNKAMELMKHRLSEETEWDVEIERQCLDPNCDGINRKGCCIPGDKPKLDAEGCLILKKK